MELENKGEIVIYKTDDGKTQLDVVLQDETVWITQQQMAELFQKDISVISRHIKNIFNDGELEEKSNLHFLQIPNSDRPVGFYNLDVIISVGYRVNSIRGVQFRQWATQRIHEYIVKGFTIDSKRLKENGGGGHWQELLDTIRDIRASEKVLYRQVLQLYELSEDYDPQSEITMEFFKIVQNKIHYATHGHTAGELMYERADAEKPFMGVISFAGKRPIQKEVLVAKNYMNPDELKKMSNLVSAYFDIAEIQAQNHSPMKMIDYVNTLDNLIKLTGDLLLDDAGHISAEQAKEKVLKEYLKYRERTLMPVEQEYFNRIQELKKIERGNKKNKE